ncbi:MAG: ribosomal protein S18-alanine N-acetyltransferase [Candidatus Eremiobacteraeota bacterium]|nr:ribosomal protein S18-alanine N-acetyltransferase [Candidatus Eremiobacteraeota bacterium]
MKAELDRGSHDDPSLLAISAMTDDDVKAVMRIEQQSFSTTWPANAFANELHDNKLAFYFVGRIENQIVAYGGIWVILEDSHVTTIAVSPEFRGRRFGEYLLLRLLDEALERGASWMTLEVRESNVAAQSLYRKYGFTTVSTRKGYYSDNNENAFVMWAGNLKSELYRNRLRALRAALLS